MQVQARSLVVELQEANRQLTESAATIENLAIVEERNRLARELHDSVSQSLYGLVLSSEAARRNLASGNHDGLVEELDSMSEAARTAQAEMRLLIYELRPPEMEELGLQRALENRLATVERRTGLQATITYDVERCTACTDRARAHRNRGVDQCGTAQRRVECTRRGSPGTGDRWCWTWRMTAVGIETGAAADRIWRHARMRERAKRLGGTFTVVSDPGNEPACGCETPLRLLVTLYFIADDHAIVRKGFARCSTEPDASKSLAKRGDCRH
ncbi:MAG: histidine kinase [Thermomicrobiales bacterium]